MNEVEEGSCGIEAGVGAEECDSTTLFSIAFVTTICIWRGVSLYPGYIDIIEHVLYFYSCHWFKVFINIIRLVLCTCKKTTKKKSQTVQNCKQNFISKPT
jgi:hypothetical protein